MSQQRQEALMTLYDTFPDAMPWEGALPEFLADAAEGQADNPARRALDLGCGRGGYSLELASRGWNVTGVDYVPEAIRRANARLEAVQKTAGPLAVRFIEANVIDFDDGQQRELVVDAGCLQSLEGEEALKYSDRLDRWAVHGGSYFLIHFLREQDGSQGKPHEPIRRQYKEILDLMPTDFSLRRFTSIPAPSPLEGEQLGYFLFDRN